MASRIYFQQGQFQLEFNFIMNVILILKPNLKYDQMILDKLNRRLKQLLFSISN